MAVMKKTFRPASMLAIAFLMAVPAAAQPTFTKVFAPDTIGPGSTTTLTFTIINGSGTAVTSLAFTDTLPAGVVIADPAVASTTCNGATTSALLSAPDGGGTITFSGGSVGASASCKVKVNVTSSTLGTHMNVSGDLTSSAGNSGTASDDLTVNTQLPGFTKSFAPSSVPLGGRSTLTFIIDNSANVSDVDTLDFTDNLPLGTVIADPARASTTCGTATIPPTLTAVAGSSTIILDADGIASFPALGASSTCTVTVDVTTAGGGALDNVSGDLLAEFVSAGKATDTLEVTVTPLALRKSFTDDPVPPGGTATLEFRIDNFDRNFSATGVAFTDDLTSALAGLTFDSLLANDCGGSVSGAGTFTITFSGGTVPPEGFCTLVVSLTVPAGATPGAYTNTTGAVTGAVDGLPVTGNMASDVLFVEPVPLLTKLFVGDPVGAGDTVVLRFTIENTSTTSMATDITFFDELTDGGGGFPPDLTSGFLPFPVTVTLPPAPDPPCGAGSSLALEFFDSDRERLSLTGGTLAAAPGAASTCTFEVTVTIPEGFPAGTYLNTTEEISATVDGATRIGRPASDSLDVVAAPSLLKEFTDDPAQPGGTVTLQFTLTHDEFAPGDAVGVTFTDDLAAALTGLTAIGLPLTGLCGPDNGTLTGSAGDTLLTFSGATLVPGEVCAFSVTLDVPGAAPAGDHPNTTSRVVATVLGETATGNPAADDLQIAGLVLTKEFTDDPVLPGGTATLQFVLENVHPTDDATGISFTDDLSTVLAGLASSSGTQSGVCGPGSSISGTSFLTFSGGNLTAGASCTFAVTLDVPAGADDDTYNNVTGNFSATLGGSSFAGDPAADALTVDSNLLALTKEFIDDPVAPGDNGTLRFTLTNLDPAQAASGLTFTDNLGAALAGLVATGLPFAACGGTVDAVPDAGTIDFSGGSLAADAACTFDVSFDVPAGAADGAYPNTTSTVTGTLGGLGVTGYPATDELEIAFVQLRLTKVFDGPAVVGGTSVLTFTVENLSATESVSDLSFSDDLDAMIPGLVATGLPAEPCGTGSASAGTSLVTFTGGSLLPGGSCTIEVDLQIPGTASAGDFVNTTSSLRVAGIPVAAPATATLTVEEVGCPSGDGSLVAHWRFDEGMGSTAADSSSNGNTATLLLGAGWAGGHTGGAGDSALALNGVGAHANAGSPPSLDNLSTLTYAAWIYPTADGDREIFSKANSVHELRLRNTGTLRGCIDANGGEACSDSFPSTIPLDTWTHVAMTYDDSGDRKVHLYVNGVELASYLAQTTATGTLIGDASSLQLLGRRQNSSRPFAGNLDEMRIYNTVLDPCRIQELAGIPCTVDADCDDGAFCNGAETCNLGVCGAGAAIVCDDGFFCDGTDTCNEDTDTCEVGAPPACDDGLYCNGTESCNEDTDMCDPGTPVVCDDGEFCNGTDTCNEDTNTCDPGTPPACDDGLYCNGTESCNEATDMCDPGTTIDCDDGVGCTVDTCNEDNSSCDNVATDSLCDDGDLCDGVETCSETLDCQDGIAVMCDPGDICEPTTGLCETACDSGDAVLVAHWPFDEGAGPTAADVSSNGNTGALKNGAGWGPGHTGGGGDFAVTLDGVNDHVNAGSKASLDNLSAFTYSAWVFPTATGDREIFSKANSTHELRLKGAGILRGCIIATGVNACSESLSGSVPLGVWSHVAMTYNNAGDRRVHLFVNGVEVASYPVQSTATGALASDAAAAQLLGRRVSSRPFKGRLDEMRIYNSVLDLCRIGELGADPGGGGGGIAPLSFDGRGTGLPESAAPAPPVLRTGAGVTVIVEGSGDVTSSRREIDGKSFLGLVCSGGSSCRADFAEGASVVLYARPVGSGSEFAGWSGDCRGSAPVTVVNAGRDTVCTATFRQRSD